MSDTIEQLEQQLSSFDAGERESALEALIGRTQAGEIDLPEPGDWVNAHFHTFYSYNPYGYSPTAFAWLARKRGLGVAGIVDFDVFDGVDEFLSAARRLGLKGIAGMETRVFVPAFATRVINSPGEPGISYHMAAGVPRSAVDPEWQDCLDRLKSTAADRNRALIERVNAFTDPVTLDYERDVLPLTPAGNATERHICAAYTIRARNIFGGAEQAADFWAEKLGLPDDAPERTDEGTLQLTLRARTMKRGGAGYVQPDGGSFPNMSDVNAFARGVGSIPMLTWLSGESEGEQAIDELLDTAMASGTAAVNIIPDRNYTPGTVDRKLENLRDMVRRCEERRLPVIAGTEMNAPGLKFVDDFDTDELRPLLPVFLRGALIVYAHSVLERIGGMGYTGDWAANHLPGRTERNDFYHAFGRLCRPEQEDQLDIHPAMTPEEVLEAPA